MRGSFVGCVKFFWDGMRGKGYCLVIIMCFWDRGRNEIIYFFISKGVRIVMVLLYYNLGKVLGSKILDFLVFKF